MPILLDELEANEATAPLEIGGQVGFVTYRPYMVTPDLERRAQERTREIGQQSALAELLGSGLLVDWDVTRGDDVIATDYESLCGVSTIILAAAFGAIISHMQPGADERKNSGAGSSNRKMKRG
jgi:hypothetical protein